MILFRTSRLLCARRPLASAAFLVLVTNRAPINNVDCGIVFFRLLISNFAERNVQHHTFGALLTHSDTEA